MSFRSAFQSAKDFLDFALIPTAMYGMSECGHVGVYDGTLEFSDEWSNDRGGRALALCGSFA